MGKYWSHNKESRKKISNSAKERYKNSTKLVLCKKCSKEFRVPISRFKDGRGKYCSKKCMYADKKGVRYSIKTEFKTKENIGYSGIHSWLIRKFGRPNFCEFCKTKVAKRFEWAKKKDCDYERKRENFIRLCSGCHKKYDDIANNLLSKNDK